MKKSILIPVISIVIIGISYLAIETFDFLKGAQADEKKSQLELQQNLIIKPTKFKNGRWISIVDSLAGIEIKDEKWILFYKGLQTDTSDIYDFKIRRNPINKLKTNHKPFEYLTISNDLDTLEYVILKYNSELLSLSYIARGNTLNYKPEY